MPRIIDIYAALPSMTGKLELEYEGELKGADVIGRELIRSAVANVFDGHFPDADTRQIVEWFDLGGSLNLGDLESAAEVVGEARKVQGLLDMARQTGLAAGAPPPVLAAAVDFVLEGLYAQKKISRSDGRGFHGSDSAVVHPNPIAEPRSSCRTTMTTRTVAAAGGGRRRVLQLDWGNELQDPQIRRHRTRLMKFKYSKYVPNPLDDLDMDQLMSKLSDLLLSSGFDNPWDPSGGMDRTIQALHDAILEALFNGGVLPPDVVDKLFGDQAEGSEEEIRERLEQLINEIIQRMQESGYITGAPDLEEERQRRRQPGGGPGEGEAQQVEFEVTDKALDFLGYKALRDLLGSLGHSSAGRHDTRDLSTGVETSGAPEALRVRRHAQPRRDGDDTQCGQPPGCRAAGRGRGRTSGS